MCSGRYLKSMLILAESLLIRTWYFIAGLVVFRHRIWGECFAPHLAFPCERQVPQVFKNLKFACCASFAIWRKRRNVIVCEFYRQGSSNIKFYLKPKSAEPLHLKFCRANPTVLALPVLVCQACAGWQARWFHKSSCHHVSCRCRIIENDSRCYDELGRIHGSGTIISAFMWA